MELDLFFSEHYNDAYVNNEEHDDDYREEVAEVIRELLMC